MLARAVAVDIPVERSFNHMELTPSFRRIHRGDLQMNRESSVDSGFLDVHLRRLEKN